MTFAPLPSGAHRLDQLADALVTGFAPADRAAARDVLVREVLPWHLSDLATAFVEPPRIVAAVHAKLADELAAVDTAARPAALAILACEARAQTLLRTATGLGIARYLLDHPQRTAPPVWAAVASPYRDLDAAAVRAAADQTRTAADAALAAATGDCREAMRIPLVHAGLIAGAASSGSFTSAAGAFVDFLRDMGESPQELDVH